MSALSHVFKQLFFFCISTPVFLPLYVDVILFNKSSKLSWIIALLLAKEFITFNFTTVYQPLCTMFFWFYSFHSALIPGGLSSSHGIPPVNYSFQHSSIPSPADTTICSAIPQWKGIPSFSKSLPPQKACL